MLQTAKDSLKEANIDPKDCDIKFIKGFSSNTGLPDASVDLITCRFEICIHLQRHCYNIHCIAKHCIGWIQLKLLKKHIESLNPVVSLQVYRSHYINEIYSHRPQHLM